MKGDISVNKLAVFTFIAGAAIGSVVTWQFTKKKYEQIAQEEIDDVKEHFSKKFKHVDPIDEPEKPETPVHTVIEEKPDIMEYARKLNSTGYTNYSKSEEEKYDRKIKDPSIPGEEPYIISPDEFGENDDYMQHSLIYYADGVLCDDSDHRLDDDDPIVLMHPENHFGEYEEDSVFIRCDARKADYEILRSLKTYEELIAEYPYKAEK